MVAASPGLSTRTLLAPLRERGRGSAAVERLDGAGVVGEDVQAVAPVVHGGRVAGLEHAHAVGAAAGAGALDQLLRRLLADQRLHRRGVAAGARILERGTAFV